jgi:cation:H+ antiporter
MTAVVIPLVVPRATLKKEYPIMMGVLLAFYAVALDGIIGRVDGILLVSGLVGFFVFLIYDARRHSQLTVKNNHGHSDEERSESDTTNRFLLMIGGIVLLAAGARAMVYAAVNVAEEFGIDPVVVGLTVVAIGTSLPELAASVVSALKQEADISLGNILGSNLLNVLFVVGIIALFQPLQVEQISLDVHFPVMIAFGLVLFPIAWTKFQITRMEGGFLLAGFAGYILFLVAPYL